MLKKGKASVFLLILVLLSSLAVISSSAATLKKDKLKVVATTLRSNRLGYSTPDIIDLFLCNIRI